MKKILYLLICIILCSCNTRNSSFNNVDDFNVEISISREYKLDHLNSNGKKVDMLGINQIHNYNDSNIIFIDYHNKNIYITNLNLNIIKHIDLNIKYRNLFIDDIQTSFVVKDTLFLSNKPQSIYKYNLNSDEIENFTIKDLKIFGMPYDYYSIGNSGYVLLYHCFYNPDENKSSFYSMYIGAVIDNYGNIKKQLTTNKNILDIEMADKDYPYYFRTNKNNYFCYRMSKTITSCDMDFNVKQNMTLLVNSDWKKPHRISQDRYEAFSINIQPIIPYNNMFLHWPAPGSNESKARLVLLDSNFVPVKKIYLKGVEDKFNYQFIICGKKLIIYSAGRNEDPNVYIFKLEDIL